MIDFCLSQAATNELDEDTKKWLEKAIGLPGSEDVGISPDANEQSDAAKMRELNISRLNRKIENLKAIENLSQLILEAHESELELQLSK